MGTEFHSYIESKVQLRMHFRIWCRMCFRTKLPRAYYRAFSVALIVSGLAPATPLPVFAQDSVHVALPEVRVSATRGLGTEATSPFSLVSIRRPQQIVDTAPGTSLEQTLRGIPGLFLSDRNHFAVGERLIVRGMGSRAPFGVRGVQIVLDGIPLTLPDGQSIADIVDPGMITSAELIRGPVSVFWGNGSGGALFLSTSRNRDDYATRVRLSAGSDGLMQAVGETNLRLDKHRIKVYASSISRDGYRDHSSGRFTRGALLARFNVGSSSVLNFRGAAADQRADHPGSLTRVEYEADPTLASAFFKRQKAGKESRQVQLGTDFLQQTGFGLVTVSAHWIRRALRNPLPFAFIDLDRQAGGADVSLQTPASRLTLAVGADIRFQSDKRKNWNTVEGGRGTDLKLDQNERVLNGSVRSVFSYSVSNRVRFVAGARFDYVRFKMEDDLLLNGDQSGKRTFQAFSPVLGFSYQLPGATVYADVGTAFETPTTTELVNRPDLTGGFNPDLDAQRTVGVEAGIRTRKNDTGFAADIAVYRLIVQDRLVAFQTEEGGERTFFRNGGENIHVGIEASFSWVPAPDVELGTALTRGRFEFREEPLDGNRLPGVPETQLTFSAVMTPGNMVLQFNMLFVDSYFVDDANTARTDAYSLADVNLSHSGISAGSAMIRPFVQVNNLFNEKYVTSVTINSRSRRYFDPGSGRTFQGGVNILF